MVLCITDCSVTTKTSDVDVSIIKSSRMLTCSETRRRYFSENRNVFQVCRLVSVTNRCAVNESGLVYTERVSMAELFI